MRIINFLKVILKGISQVMLQDNALTGILFLIAIFYNSYLMGLGALVGVFTSTLAAYAFKYSIKEIKKGLYGFNGTLVGISLIFFFKINILIICLIILGSVFSSIIMNFMLKRKFLPYTFPFVLSTWILLFLMKILGVAIQQMSQLIQSNSLDILSALSMGLGQVMFQANIITGIIFFIAILINSRISAVYALIGTSVGMLIALLFSFPLNLIDIGIFGFNSVLCGIAFAEKKLKSIIYAIISIVLSVFMIYGMLNFGIIALTAPFVFSTWIVLLLRKKVISI